MIAYLNGFKRKAWKDMTPVERIAVSDRRREVMNDPETRSVHNTLKAHAVEVRKKKEKMIKLRSFILAKRGLSA
jgi:hypothetical protein